MPQTIALMSIRAVCSPWGERGGLAGMVGGALAVVNGREIVTAGDEPLSEGAVVRMWFARVASRSQSARTQEAYMAALRRFAAFREGAALLATTRADALRYAEHLAGTGLAPASVAQALSAMRSLFSFAADLGAIPYSPFAIVRTPKVSTGGAPRMLAKSEVRAMLDAAEPKWRAMILLLATTGLRISEALDATWDHTFTDPQGNTGLRVVGKGGKAREVKLLPAVVAALKPLRAGPFLLPNNKGERLSHQAADAALGRIATKAGLGKKVSAHWLRHFLATQALAAGAPLLQVQQDLGHAALATTQRYLHAAKGLEKTSADFVGL